ncbi:putative L-glutamate gamma-semialdehyde dehydrogenase [Helianthus annuus]|uniref:L-glutamate gamma-semialdehyde dehydrogenase n=1 Tax=Helianthus annuus TaxID=4232 RepID=A0A9K3P217_HELAN|nr:putative L-glutamate gamma-semialdehyde dehydrogenase [Helianthus annuus]KAJ0697190.1 putative L-glutamate gamma-semialdehyde dehydrogenase [Helianthus annuus]KAJ0799602.1 putative L-glutamate gamma-semialdehyde dehydrogenase [Helianthus annuus]
MIGAFLGKVVRSTWESSWATKSWFPMAIWPCGVNYTFQFSSRDSGTPVEDVDFINSDGMTMNKLLQEANPRMTLFTGSSKIVDKLAYDLNGRIKVEDAGFDWKILRPDVHKVDYVSWVCDQDAYACIGQKCLTQSLLFVHENWKNSSLMSHLNHLAGRRTLDNLTIGSVLRVSY